MNAGIIMALNPIMVAVLSFFWLKERLTLTQWIGIRIGAFGALIHGPCGHVFFSLLEKNLPGANVGVVTLKVIIDQLVWSPLFAALLISFVGITSGSAPFQIYKMITISLKPLILTSWAIWPLAHYFNFRIIPTKYRLVYTNTVQLIYNVIACYTVNRYI
jgi:protein Mpv17